MIRTGLLAALLLLVSACYVYVPVGPELPEPGSKVRAHLRDEGVTSLTPVLGPGVLALDGYMIHERSDSLLLLVEYAQSRMGGRFAWHGEPVRLYQGHVLSLEQWRHSPRRTAGLAVATAAAFYLFHRILGGYMPWGGGDDDNGDDTGQRPRRPS